METKAHLIAARDLILDPKHWTTGKQARDAAGLGVSPTSYEACQWCALGALYKVAGKVPAQFDEEPTYIALIEANGQRPITVTNDTEGHAAIIALYGRAIERAA